MLAESVTLTHAAKQYAGVQKSCTIVLGVGVPTPKQVICQVDGGQWSGGECARAFAAGGKDELAQYLLSLLE
jgi:hypothetical protein